MATRWDLVTLNAPDTERAARFWCGVLHLHECEREDDGRWIVLCDSHGVRRLGLQRGEVRPGSVHLDLACQPDEFEAELARVSALGGAVSAPQRRESYGWIANLTDPDGNPFDLCAYGHAGKGPEAR